MLTTRELGIFDAPFFLVPSCQTFCSAAGALSEIYDREVMFLVHFVIDSIIPMLKNSI